MFPRAKFPKVPWNGHRAGKVLHVGKGVRGQKLYILDSNGVPLGYVFMGGRILYSMDGGKVSKVLEDMTIEELRRILIRGRTWYIT